MKVKLLRAARIRHETGEIVEVSPAEGRFLLTTGSAEEVFETSRIEAPETKTAAKETRAKKK